MTSPGSLQRQFQRYVLAGDLTIAGSINESAQAPVATRLAIYSGAYRLRLIEALAGNFPRLQQLLGDEPFACMARCYIENHPSHFRSLRWFGAALPACLGISHAQQPWLADLAQWEWAIAAAFDAGDVTPMDGGALGRVPPDQWAALRFEFHPSLQRVMVTTNAPALFKSLSEDQAPPAPQRLARQQSWLIWRQHLRTTYRSLSDTEAAVLDLLLGGACFEMMCDALCASSEAQEVPLRAATLLKGWIADQLIVGMSAG